MAARRASPEKATASGQAATDVADVAFPRGFTIKDFAALRLRAAHRPGDHRAQLLRPG